MIKQTKLIKVEEKSEFHWTWRFIQMTWQKSFIPVSNRFATSVKAELYSPALLLYFTHLYLWESLLSLNYK